MSNMNVVSILDRIRAAREETENSQFAKESTYVPSDADVETFLKVLHHLQKRSAHETAEVKCGPDLLEFNVTEITSDDEDSASSMFMDIQEIKRTVVFNLPWTLFDVDESELSRDNTGKTAINHLSTCVNRWINKIEIAS